jgi:hypothetical protein
VRSLAPLLAAIVVVAPGTAAADEVYLRADGDLRFAVGELDLAEQAGQEPSGESDLSPGMLGLTLGLGLDTGDVAIGAEAGIYVGGLNLGEIEERYFGSTDQVGSSLTVLAGLAGTYRRPLREALDLTGRVGLGYARLAASSGAGNARVDTVYLDLGGGLGYEIGGALRGRLELGAALRVHRIHRFSVTNLTEGRIAADEPAVFGAPGIQAGYVARF